MKWRVEAAGDEAGIAAVHAAAFRRPEAPDAEPPEVALVAELRASDDWIRQLSLVATVDDAVVGHVVCSRAWIDDVEVEGLGPLGIAPDHQGFGIGTTLVHSVVGEADGLGVPLIDLLGRPDYYRRFGLITATHRRVTPPHDWYGDHFQILRLGSATGREQGRFRYAAAFDRVPRSEDPSRRRKLAADGRGPVVACCPCPTTTSMAGWPSSTTPTRPTCSRPMCSIR